MLLQRHLCVCWFLCFPSLLQLMPSFGFNFFLWINLFNNLKTGFISPQFYCCFEKSAEGVNILLFLGNLSFLSNQISSWIRFLWYFLKFHYNVSRQVSYLLIVLGTCASESQELTFSSILETSLSLCSLIFHLLQSFSAPLLKTFLDICWALSFYSLSLNCSLMKSLFFISLCGLHWILNHSSSGFFLQLCNSFTDFYIWIIIYLLHFQIGLFLVNGALFSPYFFHSSFYVFNYYHPPSFSALPLQITTASLSLPFGPWTNIFPSEKLSMTYLPPITPLSKDSLASCLALLFSSQPLMTHDIASKYVIHCLFPPSPLE